MKKQLKSDLALLGITVIWGASFTLMKEGIKDIPPYTFLALRYIIGSAVLSLVFYNRVKKIDKKSLKYGILIGITLSGGGIFQILGLANHTTASKSGFITGLSVVFVPVLIAIIYKKLPKPKAIAGVLLSVLGLGLLSLDSSLNANFGDFLTFVCSLFYAFQIILIDRYSPQFDSIVLTVVEMATMSVITLVLGIFVEGFKISVTPISIFSILFTGLLCSALAYWVQMEVQKYTTPTHTAVILLGEPVFSAVIAAIFLKEIMTIRMFAGCLLILMGMLISEFSS